MRAVRGVSFTIAQGRTVGVVGESGSGKSTIGRMVSKLLVPTSGSIQFQNQEIASLPERRFRKLRPRLQIVFQDPWSSLNPRFSVRSLIEEPLRLQTTLSRSERRQRAEELAARVRLSPEMLNRKPGRLSGGQLQRVCIARSIATDPDLIVMDEPTSALDLSVRAGVLDLIGDLKERTGVSILFISHDLDTIRFVSDEIVVLYLGKIVESGPADDILNRPAHPYTQALVSARLSTDPRKRMQRHQLAGEVPSPIDVPPGCGFASRCPLVRQDCLEREPELLAAGPRRQAACHRIADGTNDLGAPRPACGAARPAGSDADISKAHQ